jgi:hypothetical protein
LNPRFAAADAVLSPEQTGQLLRTIRENNHPRRRNPTDLGYTGDINWTAVDEQARRFLNPAQQGVLKKFVELKKQP